MFRRTRQHSGKKAQQEARRLVRADPEVWQRGKDRAAFVLRRVRESLPLQLQNKVRSSICNILDSTDPADLSRITLPKEVIDVIERLVTIGTE